MQLQKTFRGLVNKEKEDWHLRLPQQTDGRAEPARLTIDLKVGEELAAYCWPGREFVLSRQDAKLQVPRGYFFPLSFLTFVYQQTGYTILLQTDFRSIGLTKEGEGLRLSLEYGPEVQVIELEICRHRPDWHVGLELYQEWQHQSIPRSQENPLRGSFHIKRSFFHQELCQRHAFEADGKCHLLEQWQEDNQLAGVDTLLLFDHSFLPKQEVRCGNADPLAGFTDIAGYKAQAKVLQKEGVHLFAYFDPYLLDSRSELAGKYGADLAIRDESGSIVHNWRAEDWHPCLSDKSWKQESARYIRMAVEQLGSDGIYLDELGHGSQYHCCAGRHDHQDFNQTAVEHAYTEACLPERTDCMAMSEFPLVDRMTGRFAAVLNDSASALDIYRFALPGVKCFRMVHCDYPLGNSPLAVNRAFFNGEGFWLDNDLRDPDWYPPDILRRIHAQYQALKKYVRYFEAENNQPLTAGSTESVLINRFGVVGDCIYTLLNIADTEQEILLPLVPDAIAVPVYLGNNRCRRQSNGCLLSLPPQETCALLVRKI